MDATTRVELPADHPGFSDPAYRARRDHIADIGAAWHPGEPIPRIEYTPTERDVWRHVMAELTPLHQRTAVHAYLAAADELALPVDEVPQLADVSDRLAAASDMRLIPVTGLLSGEDFFRALANRTFPA